jgi:thiamine biosynthesis protein ThiI
MNQVILIHYHEISLKKSNRGWFENRLQQHIEALLRDTPHGRIERFAGRMAIGLSPDSVVEEITTRLRAVFGIANLAAAHEVRADLETIASLLERLLEEKKFRSFKIDARRATKDFPLDSQQINQELGRRVQKLTGAAVSMEHPELTCYVEIVRQRAFLYFDKIPGGGGLPAGTGGKVVCLLSGGIDSPVAAFRLIRRGCQAVFVHFHSFPHTTPESQEKVRRIIGVLARFQLESRLHLVPFAEIQREIVAFAPPPLRVVLYRRFMLRIAEFIALKEKGAALVTGDSLGQVASQTLENLRTVSAAAKLPIFRPLIGDDKEHIMAIARQIGTYDISIIPDQDCCSLFVPRHPDTMARLEQVEKAEQALNMERLIQSALDVSVEETILPDFTGAAIEGIASRPSGSVR